MAPFQKFAAITLTHVLGIFLLLGLQMTLAQTNLLILFS